MKKLFKKFVILALISTFIGYNATKDKTSDTTYTGSKETVGTVIEVESVEGTPSSFQFVEEPVESIPVTIVVEEKKATPAPLSTKEPEIVENEVEQPVAVVETKPVVTPTPTPTPQPTQTPAPTPEPTTTSTPVPQFDINYWIGFAQNYAQSIGLVLESSAVDCWDNPIPAGHHCKNIEQNITDRLNRYKNLEGFTDVWIWSVETGSNIYDIYIGYA